MAQQEDSRRRAIQGVLFHFQGVADRPGMQETPERVLRAWEELTEGESVNPDDLIKLFPIDEENIDYDQIIGFYNIPFSSTCEHHLMPFHGVAHVGYVPDRYLIGASKPARLLDAFARRFQVQERITVQLADALYHSDLKPKGVMVVLEATHTCMTCRGVRKPGAVMITSAVRGIFAQSHSIKSEFLALIRLSKGGL